MWLIIASVAGTAFVMGIESHRLWLRRLHKISIQIRKAQRGGK